MSLVDRSFEEVCSIMDRTSDVAELLVEHAADFRMCDYLEDNPNQPQQQQQQTPSLQNNSGNSPMITLNQRKNSDATGLIAGRRKRSVVGEKVFH